MERETAASATQHNWIFGVCAGDGVMSGGRWGRLGMVSCLYVVFFEVARGYVWQWGVGSLEMIE